MSTFSVKATFDGKELITGFKDVKKEVEGLEAAGEDAKKSLDQMLQQKNSTTNYKRQLSQITAELNDLSVNYAKLSDAEKQSDFGKAMSQRIDELTAKAQELNGVFADVSASLKNQDVNVDVWAGLSEVIETAASAFQTYAGVLGMSEDSTEALAKTITKMATIQAGANTVVKLGKMLQKESNIVMAVTKVQTMAAAAAVKIKTAAEVKGKAATVAATVAQKALNAAANANPYVLLATAIIAVGTAIYKFTKKSNEAERAQEKLNKKKEEAKELNSKLAESVGSVVAEYTILKKEYGQLSSVTEKQRWIEENASAFDSLGLSINSVNDADLAFIKNSENVIKALKARAKAEALLEKYKEEVIKAEEAKMNIDVSGVKLPKSFFVDYTLTGKLTSSSKKSLAQYEKMGMSESDFQYEWGGGQSGAGFYTIKPGSEWKLNKANEELMAAARKQAEEAADETANYWSAAYDKALEAAEAAAAEAGSIVTNAPKYKTNIKTTTGSSSANSVVPEVFNEKSLKYAQQKVSELQEMLDRMATDSPDFEPTLKQLHEWQAAVATIQEMMKKPEIKEPEVKIEIADPVKEEVEEAVEEIVTLEDAINSVFDAFGAVGNVVSSVNSIYESFKNLPEALTEAENGWERFMVGFDAAMSILNVFTTTMSTINTLMTAFNTLQEISTALKLKDVAASGAKVTADSAAAAAAGVEATANTAAATAGAAKAVSWLPIVGPILAVAAIAAVIGGILAARSKGKYASGGIVPGASKIGDFNIARVNGGEMILNTRQQANLFSMLDKNRLPQSTSTSGEVTFRIQGDTLVGVIDNYNKKRSRI